MLISLIVELLVPVVIFVVYFATKQHSTDDVTNNHEQKSKSKQPAYKNIIFILADDLGWSDLGYSGQAQAITPHIDRLAKQGIILNSSYSYSMCTPSRNAILTGVYAEGTGLQHFVLPNSSPTGVGLPFNFSIMPQYLKDYNYSTHIVGKWHLGSCNLNYTPAHRGFDSFYGFFYGEQNYYTHRTDYIGNSSGLDFWYQTKDSLTPITTKNGTYSQITFTDRALEIIDDHANSQSEKPFFIYYSAQNPHSDDDFNVPEEYERKYSHVKERNRARILGMVSLLDDSVGRLVDKLVSKSLIDNTLIVFSSDNGGQISDFQRNYPLRGGKATVFEGGHRVRAFINVGNKQLTTPFTYDGMFHSVDWLPTLLSAAIGKSVEIEGLDGVNQWDAIWQNAPSKRTSFIYNIDPYGAKFAANRCYTSTESIRSGDWKLIKGCPGFFTGWYNTSYFGSDYGPMDKGVSLALSDDSVDCLAPTGKVNSTFDYFLFDIKKDPLERVNMASKEYACKLRELERELDMLRLKSVPPLIREPTAAYADPRANPQLWSDTWSPGWC